MPLRPYVFAPALLLAAPALAAEVELEGAFQARGRLFDSLSLTDTEEAGLPEGGTFYVEHRLWLRPRILVSKDVRLTLDVKGFDNVAWGDEPIVPTTYTNEVVFEDGLSAPTSVNDPATALKDFTLWRAWADLDTAFGRISFGRMPLHWGMGIWQNDGMGLNAEYGDTADRLQFETLVEDMIFVRGALDTHAENYLNQGDDTYAASLAVAYRSETVVIGGQAHYRHTDVADGGTDLDVVTLDAAADVDLGRLSGSLELLARFGGGDLPTGLDDVNLSGFGAAVDASLDADPWKLRVQAGFASGDGDDTDARVRTFSFDRDYNLGIMLFEQPMPIFRTAAPNATNGNRDYDQVLLGGAVSNALYVKPTLSRSIVEGFDVQASVLLARAAALPERFADRSGYGTEILGGFRWTSLDSFELDARAGVFLPGTYFRNFTNDTVVSGFGEAALGAQVTGRVRF